MIDHPQRSVRRWAAAHNLVIPEGRGRGMRIALIDDGVCRRSTPLMDARIIAKDFIRNGPGGSHGTLCASALVGSCHGYEGMVPEATLLSARARGTGQGTGPLRAALRWVLQQAPDVVCIPMARPRSCAGTTTLLRRLAESGVRVFAAAGNRDPEQMLFPAAYRTVTAVSAVDEAGVPVAGCYAGGGAVQVFAEDVPSWGSDGPCTFGRTSAATVVEAGRHAAGLSVEDGKRVS